MKTFLLLAVSVSITLAGVARAEDQDQVKQQKNRSKATQPRPNSEAGRSALQSEAGANLPSPVQPTTRTYTPVTPKTNMPRTHTKTPADVSVPNKTWQNSSNQKKDYNSTVQKKNWQIQTNPKVTSPNRDWQNDHHQNTTVQKRNWQNQNHNQNQSRHWNSVTWDEARRRHHGDHHDRHWWHSHYNRFALFWGGYYFWDSGYWYPAYGYDPAYNNYAYDEPIYGSGDLDPAQVITNVQTELQRLGYIATRSTARWDPRRAPRLRTINATAAWPSPPPLTSLPSPRSGSVNERRSFLEAARWATVVRLFSGAMDCADRRFGQCWCPND